MHSSANNTLPQDQLNTLKSLLECDSLELMTNAAGGNSKVFCVQAAGKKWAIKSYPPYAPNQRDRLLAESITYQFLNQHHVPSVPQYKHACTKERLLVIDWIDGQIPQTYSDDDIAQAIQFIRHVVALNHTQAAKELPLAAEACLSLSILIEQIQKRLERLQAHTENEPALAAFLNDLFIPAFTKLKAQAIAGYAKHKIEADAELAPEKRSLIPADFGFHNSLRDPKGQLYFFDFDYFGWDDPVKLLADILWHPKMPMTREQQKQFITGITAIYNDDKDFPLRLTYTLPLFGLRWALILLNEFIPAFWQNRQHAEAHSDHASAKVKQLKLALQLLSSELMNASG